MFGCHQNCCSPTIFRPLLLEPHRNLNASSARLFCTAIPFDERVEFSNPGIKTEVRTHEGKVIGFSSTLDDLLAKFNQNSGKKMCYVQIQVKIEGERVLLSKCETLPHKSRATILMAPKLGARSLFS